MIGLTNRVQILNLDKQGVDAYPGSLRLHHNTMHAKGHQYIECTSMRVGMLTYIILEVIMEDTLTLTLLNS